MFGFPNGDTVLTKAPAEDYHAWVRTSGRDYTISRLGPVVVRPSDKKDHYVKRCVALPGDTLTVRDGLVWINSVQQEVYPGIQLTYRVETDGHKLSNKIIDNLGLNIGELYFDSRIPGYPAMPLTAEKLETVRSFSHVVSVEANLDRYPSLMDSYLLLFPFTDKTRWTRDFYGPLWIPEKGATVVLNAETLPFYERIIRDYEHNTLRVTPEGTILVNGQQAKEYTFKQDYYFMMGDNRHNSLDSRYWGFVPEDHIVGKPSVIWLSTDRDRKFPKNIRWKRFLKFL